MFNCDADGINKTYLLLGGECQISAGRVIGHEVSLILEKCGRAVNSFPTTKRSFLRQNQSHHVEGG